MIAALVAVRAAAVTGVPRPWLAAAPVLALWTPTTLVILYSRYLSRAWDPTPVVLLSGLRMSRRDFRAWIAAQAAEGVIAGALVVALAAWLLTLPVAAAWLAPAFALSGVYAIAVRILRVRVGSGLVALAEGDPDAAMSGVAPLLAWQPLGWALVPTARLVRVQAHMMRGDRDAAITECDRLRIRGASQARTWRAMLTVAEDPAGARTTLEELSPRLMGEAWQATLLADLLDLHAGRADPMVQRAEDRRRLARRLGRTARDLSDLMDTALVGLLGGAPRLDPALADRIAWVHRIWPEVWRLAHAAPREGASR